MKFLLFLLSLNAFAAKPTTLGKALERMQEVWDKTNSYQTNFKQVVFAKRFGKRDETQGVLSVVKPNCLRWESKTDGVLEIMNGKKLVYVQPNRRRQTTAVEIYPDYTKLVDARPLSFMAGKAKFKELYNAEILKESEKSIEIKLIPKAASAETYIAELDKLSYLLLSLTTESLDSRVRMEFSGTKTNVVLPDSLFEYKPNPKDTVHTN